MHGSGGGGYLDGSYFSFKSGGSPDAVVDRFEAKTSNNGRRIDYYRNGNKAEGYDINGNHMTGPVSADIQPNGDIVYSHGYTSRKVGSAKPEEDILEREEKFKLAFGGNYALAMKLSAPLKGWNKHEITEWAVKIVGVNNEKAQVFLEYGVNGEVLLDKCKEL